MKDLKECQCSMTIRALGDGCQFCNPEMVAEIEADNLAELRSPVKLSMSMFATRADLEAARKQQQEDEK